MNRYEAFLDILRREELVRLYGFLGEEEYLKEEAEAVLFERVAREFGQKPSRMVLQARELMPDDVEEIISYASLFGGPRFVVLDEFETWAAERQKNFLKYIAKTEPAPSTTLVIRTHSKKLPVTPPRMKTHVFWKFFPRDLIRWVERRLKERGLGASRDVVSALVDRYVGEDVPNLRLVAGEIDKLSLYLGGQGAVTADLIDRVCVPPPRGQWFRFVDAVLQRRCREALAACSVFLASDPRGAVGFLSVLGGRLVDLAVVDSVRRNVGSHWKSIVQLCRHRRTPRLRRAERDDIDRRLSQDLKELMRELDPAVVRVVTSWPPWTLVARIEEAEGFSPEELIEALALVCRAEWRVKSGRAEPESEVASLITSICIPGLADRVAQEGGDVGISRDLS